MPDGAPRADADDGTSGTARRPGARRETVRRPGATPSMDGRPGTPPWMVRRPGVVLLVALLVTAGAVWGATRIEAEVDFVDTVPDHDGLDAYRDLLARLDGVRFVAVYMAHDDGSAFPDLRTDEGFDALVAEQEALTQALADRFGADTFSHTLSAYEAMKAGNYMLAKIATAGDPPESAYSLPDDPVTWQRVRQQTLDGDAVDDILARDGSSALLLAFFATSDEGEARALTGDVAEFLEEWVQDDENHPATTDHAPSGLLWASHYTDSINREETLKWAPVAAAGVAFALLWVTRRVSNTLIATASLVVALAWTYGVMGWTGIRISFLSLFLAPVVVGVGIDYAVHLLHRFEEERDAGRNRRDAAGTAVTTTGRAVALAATTTVGGLAVLLLVPAPLFAEIGGLAALGVALGCLAALTVTPALRTIVPTRHAGRQDGPGRRSAPGMRNGPSRRDRVGAALARWARFHRRMPWPALAVVVMVTGGAAWVAATQTTIESGSSENEFPQDDPVIRLQHRIEEEYGAFQRAYLVVRGDIAQPDVLLALHEAVAASASLPLYRDANAVTDLLLADEATDDGAVDIALGSLLGATGQAPSDEERLPQTPQEAEDRLDALFADPLWRTIAPFVVSRDYDLAVVAITLDPWSDQQHLRELRDALVEQADALQARLGDDHDVAAAGSPVNRAAILDQSPANLAIATLGAAAVVGVVLVAAWGRRGWVGLRMAAAGTLLVGLAALWLLASVPLLDSFYQWLAERGTAAYRAPLTDMFLLAFAVTVAVGIDDLVHLTSRFFEARDAGASRDDALDDAFRHAGRAITGTSLTTFTAFALMTGVYFLQSKNLAVLAALGVLWAYVLTLLVVPRLLAGAPERAQTNDGTGTSDADGDPAAA